MQAFLDQWFFDWMSITIPNPLTGNGQRSEGRKGDEQEAAAALRLTQFARSQGLYRIRVGNGTDGFKASAALALDPTSRDRLVTIRVGHALNMPNLEISGGDGFCRDFAPRALDLLGPVLVARADVSLDHSRHGLWDDLYQYALQNSGAGAGKGMKPPKLVSSETGRTFYWGSDQVTLRVYEKDLERVARGKLDRADADENLVRIEFTFRPETRKKSAFARLSPGEMLGTSRWARRMVEEIARMTGFAGRDDTMAETKPDMIPDARTIHDRADHCVGQAVKTVVAAAAAEIVEQKFGGDWSQSAIDYDELEEQAIELFRQGLRGRDTVRLFLTTNGVDRVRTHEEHAAMMLLELQEYLDRQARETELAQVRLQAALDEANVWRPTYPEGISAKDAAEAGVPF